MSRRLDYVHDDGGRAAAGFRGSHAKDCIIRAMAIATGEPYKDVHDELTFGHEVRTGRSHRGNGINWSVLADSMKKRGWKWTAAPLRKVDSVNLRPGEIPMTGTVLVKLPRHAVTVIDGVMHDTWNADSKGYARVMGWWSKR